MLKITIPGDDFFDEESQKFVAVGEVQLELEHSLVSLSKWESLWEKPFLDKGEKTDEQIRSYIQCMTMTPDIPPEAFLKLSKENLQEINDYINAKMSATWFRELPGNRGNGETITAELVYYWMIAMSVPKEFEHWHLNRLFTLLKVISHKNSPQKKMGRREAAAQQRALNQQRRQQFGTSG